MLLPISAVFAAIALAGCTTSPDLFGDSPENNGSQGSSSGEGGSAVNTSSVGGGGESASTTSSVGGSEDPSVGAGGSGGVGGEGGAGDSTSTTSSSSSASSGEGGSDPVCEPTKSCNDYPKGCGTFDDGCGGELDCSSKICGVSGDNMLSMHCGDDGYCACDDATPEEIQEGFCDKYENSHDWCKYKCIEKHCGHVIPNPDIPDTCRQYAVGLYPGVTIKYSCCKL